MIKYTKILVEDRMRNLALQIFACERFAFETQWECVPPWLLRYTLKIELRLHSRHSQEQQELLLLFCVKTKAI